MVATIFRNDTKPHQVTRLPHQQQAQSCRQKVKDLLPNRTVGYSPDLARAVGGATTGLYFGQILFFADKGHNPDGSIYKSEAEMSRDTGLTKREQQTARRKLLALGVIAIERRGFKFTYHFKVIWERLEQVIKESLSEHTVPAIPVEPIQTVATESPEPLQNVSTEPVQTVTTTPAECQQNVSTEREQNVVTQDRDYQQRNKEAETTNREAHLTWELTLKRLKEQVPPATYESRLKETRLVDVTEQAAKIAVPSAFAISWLERRLYGHIWRAISSILGREVDVQFVAAT